MASQPGGRVHGGPVARIQYRKPARLTPLTCVQHTRTLTTADSKECGALATATITTKGQVTIPKSIRTALGVQSGDRLIFRVMSDGIVAIHAVPHVQPADVAGIFKGAAKQCDPEAERAAARRHVIEHVMSVNKQHDSGDA